MAQRVQTGDTNPRMRDRAHHRRLSLALALRLAVLGVLGLLALVIYFKSSADERTILANYRANLEGQAQLDARQIHGVLEQIYQGERVIAGIPAVRAIDRNATNLSAADNGTIQRIYDNLFSSLALSEIYIVPRTLNPDKIDPATHEPEAPDISFDSNVAGGGDHTGDPNWHHYPEVETYEYRQMRDDLIPYMAAHYPTAASFSGINMPVITGPQIITCDNTVFDFTHKDSDRVGIILAVPSYAPDNKFKGIITAIIRTEVLRTLLPASNAALVNPTYDFSALAGKPGQAAVSGHYAAQGVRDPGLLFSTVIPIKLPDPRSQFLLWEGRPNSEFYSSPQYRSVHQFERLGIGSLALVAIMLWIAIGVVDKRYLRPAAALAGAMSDLAAGHDEIAISGLGRTDVIGRLASALGVFRESMRRAAALAASREQETAERLSRADRMELLIAGFENRTGALVSDLVGAASGMESAARALGDCAGRALDRSGAAVASSRAVSTDVQAVAAAAEQLAASVSDINRRISRAHEIAERAARESDQTTATVHRLEEGAGSIGAVVTQISTIARQTNLLALNATIEAARAGEAGRGFSVVASEVKTLAGQTAHATDDIQSRIQDIQGLTGRAVNAIGTIGGVVGEMAEISTSIVGAIEQQSVATQEIARAIDRAAGGSRSVASHMSDVETAASSTGETAGTIIEAARTLSRHADELAVGVRGFLEGIKAA